MSVLRAGLNSDIWNFDNFTFCLVSVSMNTLDPSFELHIKNTRRKQLHQLREMEERVFNCLHSMNSKIEQLIDACSLKVVESQGEKLCEPSPQFPNDDLFMPERVFGYGNSDDENNMGYHKENDYDLYS